LRALDVAILAAAGIAVIDPGAVVRIRCILVGATGLNFVVAKRSCPFGLANANRASRSVHALAVLAAHVHGGDGAVEQDIQVVAEINGTFAICSSV